MRITLYKGSNSNAVETIHCDNNEYRGMYFDNYNLFKKDNGNYDFEDLSTGNIWIKNNYGTFNPPGF